MVHFTPKHGYWERGVALSAWSKKSAGTQIIEPELDYTHGATSFRLAAEPARSPDTNGGHDCGGSPPDRQTKGAAPQTLGR